MEDNRNCPWCLTPLVNTEGKAYPKRHSKKTCDETKKRVITDALAKGLATLEHLKATNADVKNNQFVMDTIVALHEALTLIVRKKE